LSIKIHAVVPVKNLDHAKSRLSTVLSEKQRRRLASRLLTDTLKKLGESCIDRVFVVTSNRKVEQRARKLGAATIAEPRTAPVHPPASEVRPQSRLNAALEEGRRVAVREGAEALLTIPIDLLLLPSFDLDALLADIAEVASATDSEPPSVFLETDESDNGTNFLLQYPPNSIDFLYGRGSFRAHEGNAIARGRRFRELDEPALRWDVDDPSSPKRWAQALGAETENSSDLAERVLAAKQEGSALRYLLETAWARPLRERLRRLSA